MAIFDYSDLIDCAKDMYEEYLIIRGELNIKNQEFSTNPYTQQIQYTQHNTEENRN